MTNEHTLRLFDADLQALRDEVILLAHQVRTEIEQAVDALVRGDHELADAIIASDRRVDELMERIATHTTRTLARQQAMANDLRAILAAARIAPHLERVGDYAKNTAKRSKRLSQRIEPEVASELQWMGQRIAAMLQQVVQAYIEGNAALANVAWSDDAELDAMYARLFAQLLDSMRADPGRIPDAVQLLFIAKGLERAGDHVTDIAEDVYFMVSGQALAGPRPKVDESAG
jgi:phosphate transport system protein